MDAMFVEPGFMPSGFIALLIIIAAIAIGGVWAVLGSSRFAGNGSATPDRIPQLYGYTICLITLIWALSSVISIADNALSLSAPELRDREYGFEPSVSSFESFRLSYDRSRMVGMPVPPQMVKLDSIPESELRRRYEAMRSDRIRRGEFQARKGIMTHTIALLLSSLLFGFHWRWLRRSFARSAPTGTL